MSKSIQSINAALRPQRDALALADDFKKSMNAGFFGQKQDLFGLTGDFDKSINTALRPQRDALALADDFKKSMNAGFFGQKQDLFGFTNEVTAKMKSLNAALSGPHQEVQAFLQRERERELELVRRIEEEAERYKKSAYGRFETYLLEVTDLAAHVHVRLSEMEIFSTSAPNCSEKIHRWITDLRHWHCKIEDGLEILWSETPIVLLKAIKIDDQLLSGEEFLRLLIVNEGWGMRIEFMHPNRLTNRPEPIMQNKRRKR